ncbi:serine protease Hayan-like [Aedes albopictus]|uniref:Peptidase S1 domain-containing protein n=1 Tax=Aedes albopictus TaxID=7160 RepID=A0ABM1XLU5_AEDAL
MAVCIWSFVFVWISLMIRLGKGQSFEPYETSHVALIGWTQRSGAIKFDCAGSYLGKNIILTGARCLERDGALADVVRLGTAMGSPMDFHVHNVTVHYRYQAEYYYHNMAIIILKEDPQAVSSRFKPACIYSHAPPIPEGRVHLMGRDAEGSYLKTELDLVDSDKCHEYYSPTKKLKYGALLVCCMCARNAEIAKCASELGSPMQIILEKNGKRVPFLVGQKTIGRSCGTKVPGIYTRLSSDGHLPWIVTIARMDFYNHDACMEKY